MLAIIFDVKHRLSPETAQRLQTATAEQLELWTDRILDAPTSAAVFTDH